ncbi:hypothetical protein [Billgrantia montanilacus]|uniref:Type II toxin-antitoxin system HicA family toxin n=1 Tax=Billgrantia montanilacus TaxID=2282305 RepID=A0A368TQ79_9GAMM|nr:hypothetical protein [Halomonas montanilacus]RCV86889.1 hypothetical protein DU505_18840 [Halomonas montanilacus]
MARPLRGAKRGIERVVRYAVAHDWTVERTRGGHVKLSKPGCSPVFTSFTPSDGKRSAANAIAQLRRAQRRLEPQGGPQ